MKFILDPKTNNFQMNLEPEELELAKSNPESFDKFVNTLKEMYISNNELLKTKNINLVTSLQKGIETIHDISNKLYNCYINQIGEVEDVPDLPYK